MSNVILPSDNFEREIDPRTQSGHDLPEKLLMHGIESGALFRLLIAHVQDYAIFMLDPAGRITTWNIGAERIKGYLASEIIGRHFSVFYSAEDVRNGKCEMELNVAGRDGRFEDEDWRLRKDGVRFWANVVITAIRDEAGALVGFAKITRDLTERKRNEDERAARLAAEQANRTKDDFLAMLGHELRNPLAPIVMALQLTKLHPDRYPTRELQVIERQVEHLGHLVDDLLDVARIARGKLDLQRQTIDLRISIAKAIEIASPLMEQKGHHFELQCPPHALLVDGDMPRLTQVFVNLICNAAKYTDARGHISLVVRQNALEIVVEIRDDGMGIESELLSRIFEPFVQGKEHSGSAGGGLGLGLGLVHALVTLHGGEVKARSQGPRLGSTFTVRLPAVAAPAPREAHPPLATSVVPALGKLRILVVDDNEDARAVLADLLSGLGHEVRAAGDGPSALEASRDFAPELALLDIGLPGMDGHELATKLRLALPEVRLIALSGYGQPGDHAHSRAAGFDCHLVKPVEVPHLLDTIAELCPTRSGAALR